MVEAILDAAARILEEGGIGALGTNAVAQRAGVSIGSLYQYFASRDSILAELIRIDHARLLAELQQAAAKAGGRSLAESVRLLVEVGVSHQLERPELARALDYVEPTLSLDDETVAIERAINGIVLTLLKASVPSLRGRALEVAAADVAALSHGMIDAAGRRGETDRRALVERVSRAVTGYLSPVD